MPGYRIQENHDSFSVYHAAPHMVQKTTVVDGVATTVSVPYTQEFRIGTDPSVFDAAYDGDGWWTIDLDCGAQRWRGHQPTREVRRALSKLGFHTKTINQLLAKYTAEKDNEPPR